MGWLPEIRSALQCAGVQTVEVATSEADDLIATLVGQATPRRVRILSTDRDYYQLIDETTSVVNPKERPSLVTPIEVRARYGVGPQQWCDFRAIAGDPSDGIPGLPGVGMKRAAALLAGERTLDDLRQLEPVASRWEDVSRWRELICLRRDVDTGIAITGVASPKLPGPTAVCVELGLIH
jgi:DNA polymerase-1